MNPARGCWFSRIFIPRASICLRSARKMSNSKPHCRWGLVSREPSGWSRNTSKPTARNTSLHGGARSQSHPGGIWSWKAMLPTQISGSRVSFSYLFKSPPSTVQAASPFMLWSALMPTRSSSGTPFATISNRSWCLSVLMKPR